LIYPWNEGTPSLAVLICEVAEAFSKTPPFRMVSPPKVEFEIFQGEAESLVDSVNEGITMACEVRLNRLQIEEYGKSLSESLTDCEDTIETLETVKEQLLLVKEPPVEIVARKDEELGKKAKLEAHAEAQAILMRAFIEKTISFDQFMKGMRDMARSYFQTTLYDVLQNG
jgi:hypothetical protein